MHVVESLLERILDSGPLSRDDRILNTNLDAAAIKERSDLIDMDRSLQAELRSTEWYSISLTDPTPFRVALQKAGFYA